MMVFDPTGVGMNLGSTDEYQRKVGFDDPVEQQPQNVRPHLPGARRARALARGCLHAPQSQRSELLATSHVLSSMYKYQRKAGQTP